MATALGAATPQTVNFPPLADRTTANAPFQAGAVSSSGLPVSYEVVSQGGVATVTGGTITLTGIPGAVTVKASQPGNGTYEAAPHVWRSFTVVDAAQSYVKVASGDAGEHCAGIRGDGTLWTWGKNSHGQLGEGTALLRGTPLQVGQATNWADVACGYNFTVAVRTDGTLWAWGENTYGQLGLGVAGVPLSASTPVQVGTATNWKAVACGSGSTLALRTDGTLWGWGGNFGGQLGNGAYDAEAAPVQIGTDTNWASIAMGSMHTVALRKDGTLWSWGMGFYGQLGDSGPERTTPGPMGAGSTWRSVSCGRNHTMAIRSDGTLWGCGENFWGQAGVSRNFGFPGLPLTQVSADTDWASVSCGDLHGLGVRTDGTLWAWGGNFHGELGNGTGEFYENGPRQVGTATDWVAASAGQNHSLALRAGGVLWAWGDNTFGQLGTGTTATAATPVQAGTGTSWKAVARGHAHTVALHTDGTLWAWGENNLGQLGDGTWTDRRLPAQVGMATDWTAIACGDHHTLALRSDGSLWAWGDSGYGQAGTGSYATLTSPVRVGLAMNWTAISCGNNHSLGLRSDGTLWAWGNNQSGKLGNAVAGNAPAPVQVGSDANWAAVSCGEYHTLAVRTDGTLWAWGYNANGQLGDGSTTSRSAPVQVGTATNWAAAAAGGALSMGLHTDGTLWGWGYNGGGNLGIGTTAEQLTPAQVGDGATWVKVTCGPSHMAALRADGTLWTWGYNRVGQLGHGTLADTGALQLFGGGGAWLDVDAGYDHTVAVRADGTVWAAGYQWEAPEALVPGRAAGPGRAAQSLDFPALPALVQGQPILLGAVAESGLPVVYAVEGAATLAADGRTLVPTAPGSLVITARQEGDGVWLAAVPVSQTVTVTAAPVATVGGNGQPIPRGSGVPALVNHTDFGDVATEGDSRTRTYTIVNTGSEALTLGSVSVTGAHAAEFSITTLPAGSVPPGGSTTLQVTLDTAAFGLRQAVVSFSTNEGYAGLFSFAVQGNGVSQILTFPVIADHVTTDAPFALGGSTTSGLPITYALVGGSAVATVSGGVVTLKGTTGAVTVRASQAGNGTYDAVADVYRTFVVTVPGSAFVKVASGPMSSHGAGIRADGTLWSWGDNDYRQLGHTDRTLQQVGTATTWTAVACGGWHTVALRANGTLWAWGRNNSGELGTGGTNQVFTPVQIGTATTWAAVACGEEHTVALRTDGTLWAWGANAKGQLGNGGTSQVTSPVQIGTATNWAAIAAGTRHTVALRGDGTLWTWGDNAHGQLGDGSMEPRSTPQQIGTATDWTGIAAGSAFCLGLRGSGSLWSWGANLGGQLGREGGTAVEPAQVGAAVNWTQVACGDQHSMARRNDGTLWTWGLNAAGQLGDGTTRPRSSPAQVTGGGSGSGWTAAFSCGYDFAQAVRADGALWTWGAEDSSAATTSTRVQPTPAQAVSAFGWATVASGTSFTVGLRRDGTLWTWGANTYGEMGNGGLTPHFTPQHIGKDQMWAKVACGKSHAAAVAVDGSLWLWGANFNGQVGDGSNVYRPAPIKVAGTATWKAVACGHDHTLAVRADGSLWAWGSNDAGQLGLADTYNDQKVPMRVGSAIGWTAVACGNGHSAALRADGTLWLWGRPNAEYPYYHYPLWLPVQAGSNTDWTELACGADHGLALRADGTLWGWGSNRAGQRGAGYVDWEGAPLPVQVGTSTDWVSVSGGMTHSLAIRADGTLWGSGDNFRGQLGDGGWGAAEFSPVGTATNWAVVSAGAEHSAGVRSDGALWMWGHATPELGLRDPTVPERITPPRSAQTVTLAALPPLSAGMPVTLTASASSGLPVTYTVAGPATLVGNVLTATGPVGRVSVTAYQAGDAAWLAAAAVVQSSQVLAAEIEVELAAGGTDFGAVSVGSGSVTRTFTITNSGTAALSLGSVSVSGAQAADFTVTGAPAATVAAGGSTSLEITFNPGAAGLRQAVVSFSTNDEDENPFSFAIQGTGLMTPPDWRQLHFGTTANTGSAADTADADGDGLANLVEYAFGLAPLNGSSGAAQLPQGQKGVNTFTITFTEPPGVTGVTYGAKCSADLAGGSWLPMTDTGSGTTHIFSVPLGAGDTRMFVRLEVTAAVP